MQKSIQATWIGLVEKASYDCASVLDWESGPVAVGDKSPVWDLACAWAKRHSSRHVRVWRGVNWYRGLR